MTMAHGQTTSVATKMRWKLRGKVNVGVACLILGWLYLPIANVFVLSFNQPAGRYNFQFNQFTWANWENVCGVAGICDSVVLSVKIAFVATILATALGTLIAYALSRYSFRGRGIVNYLIFVPMATPEVVMGSSLLTLFVGTNIKLGFTTIIIAHVMFCLSYVVVTIKARFNGLDLGLEEAARDLYSGAVGAFCRITLPLAAPGILAAALLSFALSFDDFIVTNFNAGSTVTFPMYIWGAARRGVPPQVQVFGAIFFLIAFSIGLIGTLWPRTSRR